METTFQLSESKIVAMLITAAGTNAVFGAAAIITIPALPRMIIVAIVVFLFASAVRQCAFLRGSRAVKKVAFVPLGGVLITSNNRVYPGQVACYYASPWLTVFVINCNDGSRFNVVMAADSMSAHSHRHLRIQLLSERKPTPDKPVWRRLVKYLKTKSRKSVSRSVSPSGKKRL